MKPTRRDYCQFILSSQINYTQTYFADLHPHFSHDAINRYLQDDNVTPEELWSSVKDAIEYDDDACLIFDDSVLDKSIGIVNCLYVNLRTGRYWIIDWRVYAPDEDHKTKLVHAKEMLNRLKQNFHNEKSAVGAPKFAKSTTMHGRPRKCQTVFQRRLEGKIAAMHSDLMQVGACCPAWI